ncbi:MAG: bifunctional DNA-formamidopyrimidine glycosylase/DNA-(apurinic or apyrimidinic site) lyase [Myxococcota bacterium]
MPELPEVETVRRALEHHILGQCFTALVVRDARLRVAVRAQRLKDFVLKRRVVGLRRRAKYLLIDFDNENILMIHLGMSGHLGVLAAEQPIKKHDHIIWRLEDGRDLRFNDPRRFGLVEAFTCEEESTHPRLRNLGLEPLGETLSAERLKQQTKRFSKPIKNWLMDATQIVGIGNIYACEALFRARIDPSCAVGSLSLTRWTRLIEAIRLVLSEAIAEGGTTLRDFRHLEGQSGYFAVSLRVYGRQGEPCTQCGTMIERISQAGRSTFYCRRCQKV